MRACGFDDDSKERYECHGLVKFSGITAGSHTWKSGSLVVRFDGSWKIELFYDLKPNSPILALKLTCDSIVRTIYKGTLVIHLKPPKGDVTNIHFKPKEDKYSCTSVQALYAIIQEIKNGKRGTEKRPKSEVGYLDPVTPVKYDSNSVLQKENTSEQKFTSVKDPLSKDRRALGYHDQQGKENKAGKVFIPSEINKQNQALTVRDSVSFYSNKSPQPRHYGAFANTGSAYKRKPGFMADISSPKLPRLSDPVKYSWQRNKTKLVQSETLPTFQGFSNLGNTCYMNSILQSLFGLDSFAFDLAYNNRKLYCSLPQPSLYCSLVKLLNSRKKSIPDGARKELLLNVKSTISTTAKRFVGYQQHDAHEFLSQVLDQLKEEIANVMKRNHREDTTASQRTDPSGNPYIQDLIVNPIEQNFEFEVTHNISCNNCLEDLFKEEQFNDISLEIPKRRHSSAQCSIQDALDMFFNKEDIEYKCEKCGCCKAEVTHKFTKLPRVLILHLKRYNYDFNSTQQSKMLQNIVIPKYLTLQSHCIQNTRPPYPVRMPSHYSSPQKTRMDEVSINLTRRQKMDLASSPGFGFKHSEQNHVGEDIDEDQIICTPIRRRHEKETKACISDMERKPFRPITLEDEELDPQLAKALELSLKEANDQNQDHLDEVDGCSTDKSITALQLNQPDVKHKYDHDYDVNLQGLSEEEQLRLAIEQSMREWENSTVHQGAGNTQRCSCSSLCTCPENSGRKIDSNIQGKVSPTSHEPCTKDTGREKSEEKVNYELIHTNNKDICDKLRHTVPDEMAGDKGNHHNTSCKQRARECDVHGDTYSEKSKCYNKVSLPEKTISSLQTQSVPKLSAEAEFKLFCEEDDILFENEFCCNDWPDNKENEQPLPEEGPKQMNNFIDNVSQIENENGDLPYSYQLVSVVNHIGNSSVVGHYVSDVYDFQKSSWFSCDDSHVSIVTETDVRLKREGSGYIFFYLNKELFEDLKKQY